MRETMASCVKCGKPIGLIEYTLGDSKQRGLCKTCRKNQNWCDHCINFLTITTRDNTAVSRCLKYGYDLTDKKTWKNAANCPDYTTKIRKDNVKKRPLKKPKRQKSMLSNHWF